MQKHCRHDLLEFYTVLQAWSFEDAQTAGPGTQAEHIRTYSAGILRNLGPPAFPSTKFSLRPQHEHRTWNLWHMQALLLHTERADRLRWVSSCLTSLQEVKHTCCGNPRKSRIRAKGGDITTRSQTHGSSQLRLQTTWSNMHPPASRKAALQMHRLLTQCEVRSILAKMPNRTASVALASPDSTVPHGSQELTQCEELETQYTLSFNKRIELNLKFFPAIF